MRLKKKRSHDHSRRRAFLHKVGSITFNQVDGMVVESGLDMPMLGMSFLNRMDMKRDGQTMTLTQRY